MRGFWIKFWFIDLSIAAVMAIATVASADQQTYAPWTGPYADELPYPTDDTWLTMGWNKKQTTSTCIGKVTTPLCAVETYLACLIREDYRLCAKAEGTWIDPKWKPSLPDKPFPRSGLMHYQVTSVYRFTEASISEILVEEPDAPHQPGDIHINITWEMCGKADKQGRLSECCYADGAATWSPSESSSFLLRRLPESWIVIEEVYPGRMSYRRWHNKPEDRRTTISYAELAKVTCDQIKAPIFLPR